MADYTSAHTGAVVDAAVTKATKLPAATAGDGLESVRVNSAGTAYEHVAAYTNAAIDAAIAAGGFPATTVMLFQQAAAPTGWTVKNSWSSSTSIVIVNAADYSDGIGNSSGDSPTSWTTNVQVADHANHSHESANHTHTSAAHTHTQANHRHTYTTTPYHRHTIGGYFTGNELGTDFNTLREGSSTNTSYVGSSTCYTAYYQGTTASRTPDPTGGPSERTTGNVSASGARTHVETQDTYAPRYQHVIAATKDA